MAACKQISCRQMGALITAALKKLRDKYTTRAEFSKIVTVYGRVDDNYATAQNKSYFNHLSDYSWAAGYIDLELRKEYRKIKR